MPAASFRFHHWLARSSRAFCRSRRISASLTSTRKGTDSILLSGSPDKKARIDHPARIELSFLIAFKVSYNRPHTAGGGHGFFPYTLTQILIDDPELGVV